MARNLKKPELRSRNFLVKTYKDPRHILRYACTDKSCVVHWAIIKHDRDTVAKGKNKGQLAKAHYHFVIILEDPCTESALKKRLLKAYKKNEINDETLFVSACQEPYGLGGAYRYLVHEDDPKKAQYSYDDVDSDDSDFWQKHKYSTDSAPSKQETNREFISDLLTCNKLEMAIRYGRDYIKNRLRYDDFRASLCNEYFETPSQISEAIKNNSYESLSADVVEKPILQKNPYTDKDTRISELEHIVDILEKKYSDLYYYNVRLQCDYADVLKRL